MDVLVAFNGEHVTHHEEGRAKSEGELTRRDFLGSAGSLAAIAAIPGMATSFTAPFVRRSKVATTVAISSANSLAPVARARQSPQQRRESEPGERPELKAEKTGGDQDAADTGGHIERAYRYSGEREESHTRRTSGRNGIRSRLTMHLSRLYERGARTFLSLTDAEFDRIAFAQVLELHPRRHAAPAEEDIVAAVIGCNEAVAFRVIEPLYRSGCHVAFLYGN